jgi:hypothetical protein
LILYTLFFRFHTCYGWLSFWDWFYGTDFDFEEDEVKYGRNVRLTDLKSARKETQININITPLKLKTLFLN